MSELGYTKGSLLIICIHMCEGAVELYDDPPHGVLIGRVYRHNKDPILEVEDLSHNHALAPRVTFVCIFSELRWDRHCIGRI